MIEPAQLRRFLRHFAIDCVFDVGANAGQYAIALRQLGFAGQILSFEPNPAVARELRDAAHGDPRWAVFQIALDSACRSLTFNIMAASQFSSLREPDHSATDAFHGINKVVERVDLMTQTLVDLFPDLQAKYGFKRPFLKLDTQGFDIKVVKGAGDRLSDFAGLQSELSLTSLYAGAPSYSEAIAYYRSRGFSMSAIVPNNAGHFPDLLEMDCIMYNREFDREHQG